MEIKEIDDKPFRKAVFKSLSRRDNPRRFEVHFTDLPYSLILSFYRKLFPAEYSEEEYDSISTWMRGKGHEIGYSDLLYLFPHSKQKGTKLGKAIGSIDLVLIVKKDERHYELTTTICFGNKRKLPYIGKVLQSFYYMASERLKVFYVKMFILLAWKCKKCGTVDYGFYKPYSCKKCGIKGRYNFYRIETSRTWRLRLNDKEIKRYRKIIRKRSNLLYDALETGDWSKLPRTRFKWMREEEDEVIEWMEAFPAEVREAHKDWLVEREKWSRK